MSINLFSDTQTRPTEAMRKAMFDAEVGDEQRMADPTTNLLQERVATLLGHEAGLFLPSGTMCNEIAFRLHIRPGGEEMVCDRTAHPLVA
jgi:threonine aldolase